MLIARSGRAPLHAAEILLVVSIERVAASTVVLRTVWATESDLLAGVRRTDVELVAGEHELLARLRELVPLIAGTGADIRAAVA
jgi:hypothetical protein